MLAFVLVSSCKTGESLLNTCTIQNTMNQKRGATSPAQVNQGKKPDEKDSPTSPSTGLFGYLFSGGAQKSVVVTKPLNNLSPVGKLQGDIDITSESFLRAYEEESRANLERWSPNKTPSRPESGRIQQARDEPSWANRTPETERSPNKEIANVESEPNKGETWASRAAKQKQMEERGTSLLRRNPLNTGGEELSDEHPGFVEPIFSEKE